jgi:hypothetical protein
LARVERGVNLGAAGEKLCAMRVIESQARIWHGEFVETERAARGALSSEVLKTRLQAMGSRFETLGCRGSPTSSRTGDLLLKHAPPACKPST